MIVRNVDDGLLVLRQVDHARLCGPLVDAWREPVPERDRVARAAAHHDDGWAHWEDAPGVDGEGRPFTYRNMPTEPYVHIWERGVQDALAMDPLVGLLVSLHGARFFDPDRAPAYRAFVEEQGHLQAKLLADLGLGGAPTDLPEDVRFMQRLLAFLDGLSLFLCERWESPWNARVPLAPGEPEAAVHVARAGEDEATLDPFPFREPVQVDAAAYHIQAQRFDSDDAFRGALGDADQVNLAWTLRAG